MIQKLLVMEQTQPKFSISFKPPLPSIRTLPSPRSPAIPHSPSTLPIKRTSNSKSIQRGSVQKSRRQKQMQKEIKYTKNVKQQAKNEISFIQSDSSALLNTINHQLEDSQATVQKIKSLSREIKGDATWKRSELIQRTDTKTFDSVSQSNHRKGSTEKNEDFYLYWKNKAHEYLQSNIKFMDQISKLTKENQELKDTIQKLNTISTQRPQNNDKNTNLEQGLSEVRAMSLHYLKKIEQMQKELKRKQIIIISYQIKIKQLHQTIVGENQRIKIINSLKDQIFLLKEGNNTLLKQINSTHKDNHSKGDEIHHQASISRIKTLK